LKRTVSILALVACLTVLAAGIAFAVTRTCHGGTCKGTDRADKLFGSTGFDKILGFQGADKIRANDGDDMVKGGAGADEIYGEAGNDRVKGSQDRDYVSGGDGDDIVRGGLHSRPNDGVKDVLDCGPDTDTVYYVRGQDRIIDCEILNSPG
jgi:Ca2+-binding RTX toxin-like protein